MAPKTWYKQSSSIAHEEQGCKWVRFGRAGQSDGNEMRQTCVRWCPLQAATLLRLENRADERYDGKRYNSQNKHVDDQDDLRRRNLYGQVSVQLRLLCFQVVSSAAGCSPRGKTGHPAAKKWPIFSVLEVLVFLPSEKETERDSRSVFPRPMCKPV